MKIRSHLQVFFFNYFPLPSEISLLISPESGVGNTYNDFIGDPSQEAGKVGTEKGLDILVLDGELNNLTSHIL